MGLLSRLAARVGIARRASLENPSTSLSDPDDWFYEAMGAETSNSGVRINHETALTYAPVWRAVSLLAGTIGKLPMEILVRKGVGKNLATSHSAYQLLRHKPNREMTAFVFRRSVMACALLLGNGYAYVFRRGDGSPEELIPLNPVVTFPVRVNGQLFYVTQINGEPRKLLPENVLHVKGLSLDGLAGYRIVVKARESFGLGLAALQHGGRFFRNSARPSVVLKHPKTLTEKARENLRRSWNDMYSGLENAHKAALLEEGTELTILSNNARDSQLLETRQHEIREVANWFGIPPHKLGDTTRTAYASLEQENQSFLDDAVDPWLVTWEEECRDKLLTEEEKAADTHTVEFRRQELLRADMKTRAAYYTAATGGHPWVTVNEVRGEENMNPMEGFDEIQQPTNNFAGKSAGDEGDDKEGEDPPFPPAPSPAPRNKPPRPPASPAAVTATRGVVADAARRMAKRLVTHARKAGRNQQSLATWLDAGVLEHRGVLVEALSPGVIAGAAVTGRDVTAEAIADGMLDDFRKDLRAAGDGFAAILDHYETGVPDVIAARVIGDQP